MSAASTVMVRKRGAKVNSKQKKILLQSMADNPLIYTHKTTADFTINHHKAFWRNLSAVLNIYGPPKKTVECWKKAWKDIRLRYQKMGVDLKEIINSLKSEHVVNTQLLLEKADQISTLTRGKVDIEQALRETVLSETNAEEFLLSDMEIPLNKVKKCILDSSTEVKPVDLNIIDGSEEIGKNDLHHIKAEKSNEDLCEIAYEEILESDLEGLNDSDTSLKRKLNSKQNGYSSDDSEPESGVEVLKQGNPLKKPKLSNEGSSCNTFPPSSNYSQRFETTDTQSSLVLNDLLAELRQHNKIQSEKLALDKKCFEMKKTLLEESLKVKKDIAKAHNLLAKSIKTFIDNISFNT